MRDIAELDKDGPEPSVQEIKGMSQDQLGSFIADQEHRMERLKESMMAEVALAIDNYGWKPLGSDRKGERGLELESVKKASELGQALVTANPQVKRGVSVRTSYIWGAGVTLNVPDGAAYSRSLRRVIGSVMAQFEVERTLASDGNLFIEHNRANSQPRVRRVPLHHVSGAAGNPDDNSVIEYILLRYNVFDAPQQGVPGDPRTVSANAREVSEWVPTVELEGTPVNSINDIEVNKNKRIKHIAVNRLDGWWWGVPDLYASAYWVRAYKKYLEQCATLNEAYAQFAYKASANSREGADRMASQMAQAPGIDPATGQPLSVGATAILGANQDLIALQHGRPVDFSNGLPLAALVAAGLDIPLQVLTSDASTGGSRASDQSLDEATKKIMQARQKMMGDELDDVSEMLGQSSFDIQWPRVGEEPLHRTIQAVDQAIRSGMLSKNESRAEVIRALGINSDTEEPPDYEGLPLVAQAGIQDPNAPVAQPEPPSYGDHQMRDNGEQAHTSQT